MDEREGCEQLSGLSESTLLKDQENKRVKELEEKYPQLAREFRENGQEVEKVGFGFLSFFHLTLQELQLISLLLKHSTWSGRALTLKNQGIADEGVLLLCEALSTNHFLKFLDLSGNDIGEKGGEAIKELLNQNSTLINIQLEGNERIPAPLLSEINQKLLSLSPQQKDEQRLRELEKEHPAMWKVFLEKENEVNLNGQQENSDMSLHLTNWFSSGRVLTHKEIELVSLLLKSTTWKGHTLRLGANELGDQAAKLIADALSSNTTLQHLFLDKNLIGDEGTEFIGQALATNQSLKTLNMDSNKVRNLGAIALGQGLSQNNSLTKLSLAFNEIGMAGGRAFDRALDSNLSLTEIILSNNSLGTQRSTSIGGKLDRNLAYQNKKQQQKSQ